MRLPDSGDVFEGRYEIVAVLGQGAFGRVYRARDLSMQRTVALKVLSPRGDEYSTLTAARFVREAKLLAALQDPHTLTLYDFGEASDGLLYMATEFIEGSELKQILIREIRLPEDVVVHILRQLLSSLREAHSRGLLHRDIKPANVIVYRYEGDRYRVKLLDFGLAKSVDVDATQLTGPGRIAGTPRYMSPEQVLGVKLTAASDIYSLGLVAYEMLVGEPAIDGADMSEMLRAQVEGPPVEVPEVFASPRLRQIVGRMTDRNLLQRASDAQSVLVQLETLRRASAPVARTQPGPDDGRPASAASTATAPRRPSPGPLVLALGAVSVVGVMIGGILWPTSPPPEVGPPVPIVPMTPSSTAPERTPDLGVQDTLSPLDVALPTERGCGRALASTAAAPGGVAKIRWGAHEMALVVPTSYDPDKPHPLVILLHDAGGTSAMVTKRSRVALAAEKYGFIVAAPRDRRPLSWREPESIDEVYATLEHIQEQACIDPDRIYLWGHGFGSQMAQLIACERDDFAAVASTYFRTDGIPSCLRRPIPYIAISGREDRYAPIEGGIQCLGRDVMSVDEQDALWTEHNRCTAPRKHGFCSSWTCEAAYRSCVIPGGRRFIDQPERSIDLLNCDGPPTDVEVAELVWDFFDSLPR